MHSSFKGLFYVTQIWMKLLYAKNLFRCWTSHNVSYLYKCLKFAQIWLKLLDYIQMLLILLKTSVKPSDLPKFDLNFWNLPKWFQFAEVWMELS